jgi:gamma-glutamyl hercynylcysteine S-oxide synthase
MSEVVTRTEADAEAVHLDAADIEAVADGLERARRRTLALVDPLSEAEQRAQVSPLMSPFVWDLAHIGNYEELWLLRALDGRDPIDGELDDLYNAFEHPRWRRPALPILGPAPARDYLALVREQVIDLLGHLDRTHPDAATRRLLDDAFVYGMVVQHEHQHDETLLATHQLRGVDAIEPPTRTTREAGLVGVGASRQPTIDVRSLPDQRRIAGGAFTMGTSAFGWAYDNERIAHRVELADFLIDTTPVTNTSYRAFVEDGGYEDERLWTPTGWAWRRDQGLQHPQFWERAATGSWSVLRFGRRLDLDGMADEPVQHVCWYEADAFARWAGRRLPTEAEWERAAVGPRVGDATDNHLWPWGGDAPSDAHANLGQTALGPSPVDSHPAGASADGCLGMIGDVWEWTSSDFLPYPGFEAWPYREYSEVFWGGQYKVLRGGSWATDPVAIRASFRNWDLPIRRQIFAGFRCAQDA